MTLLAEFGTGQVFWSMLWFFMFFIWIWLLIIVFSDIFRSHDLGGWAKALWVDLRHRRAVPRRVRLPDRPRSQDAGARRRRPRSSRTPSSADYVQTRRPPRAAAAADELAKLADLRDKGVISEAEFQQAKAKVIG